MSIVSVSAGALKDVSWSMKAIQNIAQERNQHLRDKYMFELN